MADALTPEEMRRDVVERRTGGTGGHVEVREHAQAGF